MAKLAAQVTRTDPGAAVLAVSTIIGIKSFVNKKGPSIFVPNCKSCPWVVLDPFGGNITPALLTRTSRRVSFDKKFSTDALMVDRSLRSSNRKCKRPEDDGCSSLI